MAYSSANPPALVSESIGGGGSLWRYSSADDSATVNGAGYIANGEAIGMTAGDIVLVTDTTGPMGSFHYVASIASGAATLAFGSAGGPSYASDAEVSAIAASGWEITYDTPPAEFDPEGDPKYVAVERAAGFSGVAASDPPTESIVIMKRERLAYPSQASLHATTATLQNFIYAGDKVYDGGGVLDGVTNNSTRPAPKPIAAWLNHDRDTADAATYTLRLVVLHAHARNGKPVAGVRFVMDDGSATETVDVATPTKYTFAGSGLSAVVYEAAIDMSALADVTLCTASAVIYPWVGAAFDIATDADANPSPNLCPLKIFNNHQGTDATLYAYVDGVGAAPAVSTNAATARTTPYATVEAALAGIETADGTDVDRGEVRCMAGTHTVGNCSARTVTARTPLITLDEAASKATVKLQQTASLVDGLPDRLKIQGVTIQRGNAAFEYHWCNGALSAADNANLLVLEDVTFDLNGHAAQSPFMGKSGRVYLIDCDGDDLGQWRGFSSSAMTAINIWGGSGVGGTPNQALAYSAIGCDCGGNNTNITNALFSGLSATAKAGQVIAFNKVARSSTGVAIQATQPIGDRGWGVAGNVCESYSVHSDALIQINADANDEATQNLVMQMNTVVGQRCNLMYSSVSGDVEAKSGYEVGTLTRTTNSKGDVFATDGAADGNWPWRYQCGKSHIVSLRGDESGASDFTPAAWLGEVKWFGGATGSPGTPIDPGFADDQSNDGGDAGDGDYTPTAINLASYQIPAEFVPFNFDLAGAAIPLDGSAVPGALQP